MNEVERLAYLEAMGVESYIPRMVLPGALPSPLCDMPILVVETPVSRGGSEALSGAHVLKQLVADSSHKPVATQPRNSTAQPLAQKTMSSTQVSVRFHWAIFLPTPTMLLLIPAAHTDRESMQLLKKILAAIGVAEPTAADGHFAWPPAISAGSRSPAANSLADAKETLHGLLEGYQLKQKQMQTAIDQVLVFDENLGQTLFDDFNIPGMQVRILPSLQLMLNSAPEKVAALKQAAWQRLKDLKKP